MRVKRPDRITFIPDNGMFYTRLAILRSQCDRWTEGEEEGGGPLINIHPRCFFRMSTRRSRCVFVILIDSAAKKKVKGAKRPFGDVIEKRSLSATTSPMDESYNFAYRHDGIHLLFRNFLTFLSIISLSSELMRDSPRSYHDLAWLDCVRENTSPKVDYTN